jgi:hypothetical protein
MLLYICVSVILGFCKLFKVFQKRFVVRNEGWKRLLKSEWPLRCMFSNSREIFLTSRCPLCSLQSRNCPSFSLFSGMWVGRGGGRGREGKGRDRILACYSRIVVKISVAGKGRSHLLHTLMLIITKSSLFSKEIFRGDMISIFTVVFPLNNKVNYQHFYPSNGSFVHRIVTCIGM